MYQPLDPLFITTWNSQLWIEKYHWSVMHRDTESKFSMIGSIITPDNLVPFQVSFTSRNSIWAIRISDFFHPHYSWIIASCQIKANNCSLNSNKISIPTEQKKDSPILPLNLFSFMLLSSNFFIWLHRTFKNIFILSKIINTRVNGENQAGI